jgi:hypothetical protein
LESLLKQTQSLRRGSRFQFLLGFGPVTQARESFFGGESEAILLSERVRVNMKIPRGRSGGSQRELPDFRHQVVAAPVAVRLFLHQAESGLLVEVSSGGQLTLRP